MSVGMLHSIPTVCGGLLRDILVTVNFWSKGRITPVHRVLDVDGDVHDFGRGWQPLLGVGDDAIPRRVERDKTKSPKKRRKGKGKSKRRKRESGTVVLELEPGKVGKDEQANGLKFRPEYNKFIDFFGRYHSKKAPWHALSLAIDGLDLSRCVNFVEDRDRVIYKRMKDAVENIKLWYDEVLCEQPSPDTVKDLGHSLWQFWNDMISTVFPLDRSRIHKDVPDDKRLSMTYDPRPFGIGPGAHAALVHCHEWIVAVGPSLFPKQIEKGGEHALNRVSGLSAVLPIPKFGHLERPGIHLAYALASNFGKGIRAATVASASVEDDIAVATTVGEAVISNSSACKPGRVPCGETALKLAWFVAGMKYANPDVNDAHDSTTTKALVSAAERQRNPAAGLGVSRGPHGYHRRAAKEMTIGPDDYNDVEEEVVDDVLPRRRSVKGGAQGNIAGSGGRGRGVAGRRGRGGNVAGRGGQGGGVAGRGGQAVGVSNVHGNGVVPGAKRGRGTGGGPRCSPESVSSSESSSISSSGSDSDDDRLNSSDDGSSSSDDSDDECASDTKTVVSVSDTLSSRASSAVDV